MSVKKLWARFNVTWRFPATLTVSIGCLFLFFRSPQCRCILAGVTADHRVLFYGNGRWTWEELDQPSAQWCKYVRTQDWLGVDRDDEDIFTTFKNRSYLLGTIGKKTWFIRNQCGTTRFPTTIV